MTITNMKKVNKFLSTAAFLGFVTTLGVTHQADASTGENPVINVPSHQQLEYGSEWSPYKNVTAYDKEDGDLSNAVYYEAPLFSTSEPGTYSVDYYVWDTDDNIGSATSQLEVLKQGQKVNNTNTETPNVEDTTNGTDDTPTEETPNVEDTNNGTDNNAPTEETPMSNIKDTDDNLTENETYKNDVNVNTDNVSNKTNVTTPNIHTDDNEDVTDVYNQNANVITPIANSNIAVSDNVEKVIKDKVKKHDKVDKKNKKHIKKAKLVDAKDVKKKAKLVSTKKKDVERELKSLPKAGEVEEKTSSSIIVTLFAIGLALIGMRKKSHNENK